MVADQDVKRIGGVSASRQAGRLWALSRRWRLILGAPLMAAIAAGLLLVLPVGTVLAAEVQAAPVRVAVFDFELIDTSLQGEVEGASQAETARLAMLGRELREAFAAAPGHRLADLDPVRDEAARRKLRSCPGCARKLAAEIGADLAVTGTVQKVSNLILNINIHVQDVATGGTVQAASADIRGNTDETWRRGMAWLIRNRLKLDRRP